MRTRASSLALIAALAFGLAADAPPPAKDESPLQVGKDLPGAFHPYNVTGPHKKHYHCLISQHGLDPMVMIFHKNVDFTDPLRNLLQKLETAIDKNPNVRLGAFAVFLPDDLAEVVGEKSETDDARIELEKQVAQKGEDLKLKHVVLCLDGKADVAKYKLDDANLVTVVLYNKFKIVAVFALPKSEFTDAAVEKIMSTVAEKLGAPASSDVRIRAWFQGRVTSLWPHVFNVRGILGTLETCRHTRCHPDSAAMEPCPNSRSAKRR